MSDDQSFADEFENHMKGQQVIQALLMLRAAKGLNQKDIADRIKCTQSRISKLESSCDGDLRLDDLCGYASALDLSVAIVLLKTEGTIVDRVKFHAAYIKRLMDRLAELSKDDESTSRGFRTFCGEAAFNLLKIIQDAAKVVQDAAHGDSAQYRIEPRHSRSRFRTISMITTRIALTTTVVRGTPSLDTQSNPARDAHDRRDIARGVPWARSRADRSGKSAMRSMASGATAMCSTPSWSTTGPKECWSTERRMTVAADGGHDPGGSRELAYGRKAQPSEQGS